MMLLDVIPGEVYTFIGLLLLFVSLTYQNSTLKRSLQKDKEEAFKKVDEEITRLKLDVRELRTKVDSIQKDDDKILEAVENTRKEFRNEIRELVEKIQQLEIKLHHLK